MLTICIPTHDQIPVGFARSLCNLTAALAKFNVQYQVNFISGTVIPELRNQLALDSVKNSDYTLWLDSDMHFPSDVFYKLKNHNLDIVAATYSTRRTPLRSVAFTDMSDLDQRLEKTSGLHEVAAVGMGCMLVKNSVYENMPQPWFDIEWDSVTKSFIGEDLIFCRNARRLGFKIFVDADIKLAHYGTKAYTLGEVS